MKATQTKKGQWVTKLFVRFISAANTVAIAAALIVALTVALGACTPASEESSAEDTRAMKAKFEIILPIQRIMQTESSIKPEALGQLMMLSNFGLQRVFLESETPKNLEGANNQGNKAQDVDIELANNAISMDSELRFLRKTFGERLEFVSVTNASSNVNNVVANTRAAVLAVNQNRKNSKNAPSWYVDSANTLMYLGRSQSVLSFSLTSNERKHWQRFLFNWVSEDSAVIHLASDRALKVLAQNVELLSTLRLLLSSPRYTQVLVNQQDFYSVNQPESVVANLLEQSERATVFITINQTNDIQPLPLPFGFMAVAKVTRWQTGESEFTTFVTSTPLNVNPHSLAIVIRR